MIDQGEGGEDAFDWEDLYRRHYAATVRLAGLMLGDYQSGEDIAQDAFARLLEVQAKVEDPAAYLRGTVINLCRTRIRRGIVVGRPRARRLADRPGSDESIEIIASRGALRDSLLRLSRRQREAVVLRFYGDMTEPEIAKVMGLSVGSVKTHLHRALAVLSQQLEALR